MNFYNIKKSIALAKNVEIDRNNKGNFNIFAIGDEDSGIYKNFLYPNFKRKLGSYVIVDYNNRIYNDTKDMFKKNDFEIKMIDLSKEYNPFEYIKNESNIMEFSMIFFKNSTVMKSEDIFYVDIAKVIFELVSLYVLNKVPANDRNINYIRRIIKKLKQNDVEYFKRIFFKIDESSETYKNIAVLNKMNDKLYQNVLDLVLKLFEEMPKTTLEKKETKVIDFTELYNKPTVLFLEMSECLGLNSLLCKQIQKRLYDYADTKRELNIPIFFIYNKIENIGYIPNLSTSVIASKSRNAIWIINFADIKYLQTVYKKQFESIIDNCNYGLIFKTSAVENIEYIANLIKENKLMKMYENIMHVKNGCIVYQKGLKITEGYLFEEIKDDNGLEEIVEDYSNNETNESEKNTYNYSQNAIINENINEGSIRNVAKKIEEEKINIVDTVNEELNFEINDNKNTENTEKANSFEKVETREEILRRLKEDIDKENASIKREHLVKIYNAFYN